MFFSTRNKNLRVTASKAILDGLSKDGGLYLPEEIIPLDYEQVLNDDYVTLGTKILGLYLDDYQEEELTQCLRTAYDKEHFPEKIFGLSTEKDHTFLELFHGLTLTFKDMALSLFPYLLSKAREKHPDTKPIHILTATSGDTGSAVLSGFSKQAGIKVSVLYPENGISNIQEKQMLSFTSAYSRAYALKDANFDDCQSLVKKMLVEGNRKETFTSANSINIGRLLPQIIYYYASYIQMIKKGILEKGEKIDIIVPTGNFGDIFAAYLSKRMSLPISKLVIASNENRILTDFLDTGVYDLNRKFIKTNSPSMDILISSNLERLLSLTLKDDQRIVSLMEDLKTKKKFEIQQEELNQIREDFSAISIDQRQTEDAILKCYQKEKHLLDPHSAVAYASYLRRKTKHHTLIVQTASMLKFPETILESLHIPYKSKTDALDTLIKNTNTLLPSHLRKALEEKTEKESITENEFRKRITSDFSYRIKVPATSANLGPGFDVMGISLSLYNTYLFRRSEEDILVGFEPGYSEKENNLILASYQYAFAKRNLPYQPIYIKQEEANIPPSRGLGSSAACIISGLLMANEILNHLYTKEEIYQMAVQIEGHPDNVGCLVYGDLVVNVRKEEGNYIPVKIRTSPKLNYLLVIPNNKTSTSLARKLLKEEYPLKDCVLNLSHVLGMEKGLEEGNLDLIYESIQDRIHVPYRKEGIPDYDTLLSLSRKYRIPFTISGSGSTTLFVLDKKKEEIIEEIRNATDSKVILVSCERNSPIATILEEEKNEK